MKITLEDIGIFLAQFLFAILVIGISVGFFVLIVMGIAFDILFLLGHVKLI